jgi:hypothetical protein
MSYAFKQSKLDFLRIANPDLQQVFAQTPALFYLQDLAATAVSVHAAVREDAAEAAFTGTITNPAHPRSLSVNFASGWQGGNITIVGLDQFGRSQTETITANAGNTVQGTKIFSVLSSATKGAAAGTTDTATLQTGTIIGLPVPLLGTWGIMLVDGVAELATWNATVHGFTPGTTAPNGSHDYTCIVPVDWMAYKKLVISEMVNV